MHLLGTLWCSVACASKKVYINTINTNYNNIINYNYIPSEKRNLERVTKIVIVNIVIITHNIL